MTIKERENMILFVCKCYDSGRITSRQKVVLIQFIQKCYKNKR